MHSPTLEEIRAIDPGLLAAPALESLADSLKTAGGSDLFQVKADFEFDPRLLLLQEQYAYDPNAWVEDVIGPAWDPDPWQSLSLDELVWDRFVALSTGTGPGKTAFCSVALLFFLANRPFPKVLCTAPTQPQLKRALWPEIAKWMRHSTGLGKTFEWTQTRVTMRGQHAAEWFAEAKTARPMPGQSSVESLQGLHADNILIIVDEASGVADQVMNALDGCITTKGVHIILAGNPVRKRGYFYRTISDERQRRYNGGSWHVHFISAEDSKHVDTDALQRNINLYGKNSDYFRVKVKGLPPISDVQGLISPEQIYEMHMRKPDGLESGISVIACDPARFGSDDSVIYVRKGWVIKERVEVYGMDGPGVAKVIDDLFEKWRTDFICIDSIGIGASVYDQVRILMRKYDTPARVEEVIVGEAAINDDKFINLRAELFWMLQYYVVKLSIPIETDRLDDELPQITYGWNRSDAKVKITSKDELRAIIGRSPNDADVLAICCYPDAQKDALRFKGTDIDYFQIGARGSGVGVGKDQQEESDQQGRLSSAAADPTDPGDSEHVDNTVAAFFQTNYSGRRSSVVSAPGSASVNGRHRDDEGSEARLIGLNHSGYTTRRRFSAAFRSQFAE